MEYKHLHELLFKQVLKEDHTTKILEATPKMCRLASNRLGTERILQSLRGTNLIYDLLRIYYSNKENRQKAAMWVEVKRVYPSTNNGNWSISVKNNTGTIARVD